MKILLIIFTLFLFNLAYAEQHYAPVDVEMNVQQISEHCYYVQGKPGIATDNAGFISNSGFVVTQEGVVIIDSLGSPSLAWKLLQEIRKITDKPIVKVIVTHYHADHIYGLQVFKKLGAKIIAPRGSYEYINSAAAYDRLEERRFSLEPWVNENTYIVKPDELIENQLTFMLGGITFQLNYLGSAHSSGDLTVYIEQDKTLFSGDIIFEGRIPFVGDADTKTWLQTLKKFESENLNTLVPGHGGVALKPTEAINYNKEYLEFLRTTMGNAVNDMQEFSEAYAETDWSKYKNYPAFDAANRRNAYQVFLSLENESLIE